MAESQRKVKAEDVVRRYAELRNAAAVGREFGITRQRVLVLVRRAGLPTERPERDPADRPKLKPGRHPDPESNRQKMLRGEVRMTWFKLTEGERARLRALGAGDMHRGLRKLLDAA